MTVTPRHLRDLNAELTEDEVQSAINLTPDQKKAVAQLRRAVTKCEKAGVLFYSVLRNLSFLNGNNIHTIGDDSDFEFREEAPDCLDLNSVLHHDYINNEGFDGWADDTHYVFLTKEAVNKLIEERR